MPLIRSSSPRTRQPQGPVQPSAWARSRGIGSLLLPSAGLRDLVDGGTWSSWGTAPVIGTGLHGRCIDSTAAFGGLSLTPAVNQATAAQTHILLVETTATSGAYAGLLACASGDGSSASVSVQRNSGNTQWATWCGVADTNWSSPTSQAIGPSLLILTGNSAGTYTYLDGTAIETTAGAPVAQSNSRLVLGGERAANAGYATKTRIYLYAHLTQRLTAGEVAALSANPWQLFAPAERRIWVPSAGGSLPTLSAATYMPGSLTSSGFRPRVTAS